MVVLCGESEAQPVLNTAAVKLGEKPMALAYSLRVAPEVWEAVVRWAHTTCVQRSGRMDTSRCPKRGEQSDLQSSRHCVNSIWQMEEGN